ncbi:MAG TPA: YggS family pyridoxal phosphate-dependent enzyme [Thermoanaerobaculia bacterium]|nr:YggS family pyridoxal phosphate-dependent enzyme [Thermoanaerobaculia bacterium]
MSDESVGDRLRRIERRIAEACARAGRRPEEVRLLGASKGQPVAALCEAWEAGLRLFGENRVQEAAAKAPELPAEIEWHLIGPLQTNKVRRALDLFAAVHSVDRPRIAEALAREAAARGVDLPVFLEVNLASEASKHGFPAAGLAAAAAPLADLPRLRVVGLMAVPPLGGEPEASRPWFRRLRALRDELAARPEWRGWPGWLSMGMSDDFEVAVEEGATHVRVGTALFGPRRPAPSP